MSATAVAAVIAEAGPVLECMHTEFRGKRRERVVCRSRDRVQTIQISRKPVLYRAFCHEHALPYKYEESFEACSPDDPLEGFARDDPRVVAVLRLREDAREARLRYMLDRRQTRLLREEARLIGEADRLLDQLLASQENMR